MGSNAGIPDGPMADPRSRVDLRYDVEMNGEAKEVELPFVVGVIADLSGHPRESLLPLRRRGFVDIDSDTLDNCLRDAGARVTFTVPDLLTGSGGIQVDLGFACLADFGPAAVVQGLPALNQHLVRQADAGGFAVFCEQLSLVLQHSDFLRLESTWRGLAFLLRSIESGQGRVKVRVLNLRREELDEAAGVGADTDWQQSTVFRGAYEVPFGTRGGEPFTCLVGDYSFSHTPADVAFLEAMGRTAAAAHAPFVAGADPGSLGLESWGELGQMRVPRTGVLTGPERLAWDGLRASPNARYLALAVPRFLGRAPYADAKLTQNRGAFSEVVSEAGQDPFVWVNAAYAFAANVARACQLYAWPARVRGVESGGMVEGLPIPKCTSVRGDVVAGCPVECALTDRLQGALERNGLMPLVHWKNTDYAVFPGAQSLHAPQAYADPEEAATAALAARLPYLMAACRFVHYMKVMVRDAVGRSLQPDETAAWLGAWARQYVTTDPDADDAANARCPLSYAEVQVSEDDAASFFWNARVLLGPRYQLHGLTRPMCVDTRFPGGKSP